MCKNIRNVRWRIMLTFTGVTLRRSTLNTWCYRRSGPLGRGDVWRSWVPHLALPLTHCWARYSACLRKKSDRVFERITWAKSKGLCTLPGSWLVPSGIQFGCFAFCFIRFCFVFVFVCWMLKLHLQSSLSFLQHGELRWHTFIHSCYEHLEMSAIICILNA